MGEANILHRIGSPRLSDFDFDKTSGGQQGLPCFRPGHDLGRLLLRANGRLVLVLTDHADDNLELWLFQHQHLGQHHHLFRRTGMHGRDQFDDVRVELDSSKLSGEHDLVTSDLAGDPCAHPAEHPASFEAQGRV